MPLITYGSVSEFALSRFEFTPIPRRACDAAADRGVAVSVTLLDSPAPSPTDSSYWPAGQLLSGLAGKAAEMLTAPAGTDTRCSGTQCRA